MKYIFILDDKNDNFDVFRLGILQDYADVVLAESEDENMYKIIKGRDEGTLVRPQNITKVKTND